MRAAPIFLALIVVLCGVSYATAGDVDLSDRAERAWAKHIGRLVTLSGTVVRAGEFGPGVTAGHGILYIKDWHPTGYGVQQGDHILVEGRLRYQPPGPGMRRSHATSGFFYILAKECVIRISVT